MGKGAIKSYLPLFGAVAAFAGMPEKKASEYKPKPPKIVLAKRAERQAKNKIARKSRRKNSRKFNK